MSLFPPAAIREEEDEEPQVPNFDRSKKPSYNPLSTSIGGWPCVYIMCVCVCLCVCPRTGGWLCVTLCVRVRCVCVCMRVCVCVHVFLSSELALEVS